jgi:putative ABC transport system permease protein
MQAEFIRVINETNTDEGARYGIPDSQRTSLAQGYKAFTVISIVGCLILMLIPAVNILSLNVSKSHDRSEEIAIRKAFGAPVYTIFAQLFLENILLTLAGAIIGIFITPLLLNALDQMILGISMMPITFSLRFDLTTVLIVAVPCVLLFSFLSGSIPAWITAKKDIVNVLKGEEQ